MRRRSGLRGVPVILVWLLLIAGCGGGGAPVEPGGEAAARTVAATLGDPRTVDPCTLTDPAGLRQFGAAEFAGTVSLDYCLLRVRRGDGALVQLAVGELRPTDPASLQGSPVLRQGGLRIAQDAPLPGHCTRRILFDDGVEMVAAATLLAGEPGPGLCSVADSGTRGAVDVIAQHRVGHRSFPAGSWAMTDPCEVLDSSVVREVPGLEHAEPVPSPSRHQCQWGERSADSPRVRLVHTAGDPPEVLHGSAVEEDVAGRSTVISVVGGDPSVPLCSAETGHLPFGAPGSGQVEVAMLVVAIPGSNGITACEFARGLAERAWPALPAA